MVLLLSGLVASLSLAGASRFLSRLDIKQYKEGKNDSGTTDAPEGQVWWNFHQKYVLRYVILGSTCLTWKTKGFHTASLHWSYGDFHESFSYLGQRPDPPPAWPACCTTQSVFYKNPSRKIDFALMVRICSKCYQDGTQNLKRGRTGEIFSTANITRITPRQKMVIGSWTSDLREQMYYIYQKFPAPGYGSGIESICAPDAFMFHHLVRQDCLLTEKIWNNIRGDMIAYTGT
ncbi:hypothetical protein ARMGADRAFT_1040274 [Armillaria gallica]|uniref:Tyrosinase copper-binding domain-containing protein n=1 Tax=Armillaria gallica TaxID=47427 RepID=A0A2H3CAV1_ARMGA|nr:hypothetical protein ARMGADRAFT_1040274 [Armillaria gallica]